MSEEDREFIMSLKREQVLKKQVLELFRQEIEAEVDRRVQDADRKMIVEVDQYKQETIVNFYRLGVPVSHIIQATKLSEEEVLGIIGER